MRADRLLSILLLLQIRGQATARELAERLEVSERTIHRDMEALSAAGVPVYARRGPSGGWVLPEEYRTETAGLNDAEVRAIFLAKPPRLLADLGLDRAAEAGLIKLLAALPAGHRRDAEHVRGRIHVDVSGWHRTEEAVPLLPAIQAAVLGDRRLRLRYGRDDVDAVERLVDPLGLVAKGSVWYLVAAVRVGLSVSDEVRTYRVSRVRWAEALDERSRRPAGFDLASFWEASKVEFVERLPRFAVCLRADGEHVDGLRRAGFWSRVVRVDPPDEAGWSSVAMRFERFEDAVVCLLGFGPGVEVLEPADLRDEVRRRAERTVALYRCAGRADVLSSPAVARSDPPAALPTEPESSERRTP
jgi:predicted DNA-binding transcriptional regulator YafY